MKTYQEELESMTYEELLNEFCDVLGCEPESYFSNPVNYNNRELWIDKIVEAYTMSTEERMDKIIKEINKQTRIINGN